MSPSELSEKLWDNAERVAKYLLPKGHLEGREWCAGSVDGEAGKSLKINLGGKKNWADFASGDSGDLLDLWVLVRNCQLHDAMREAKEFLGLKDDDHHFETKKKTFSRPTKKGVKKANHCYEYLATRGITRETADLFKVTDAVVWHHDENREIPAVAYPYLRNGDLLQVKRIGTERPNGKKIIMAEADCEPCLFGWQALDKSTRLVVLCEGEIDCMTFTQLGYDALSVPFGGGKGAKQQWIEYEYHNLDRFTEVWLCLDNDDVGREAAKEIARRLGEHRCRLVELPHKDINECLMAGMDSEAILEYMERAKFFDPDELCSAGDLLQETIEAFEHRDIGLFSSPWTPLNYNFKFRASEMTLINGVIAISGNTLTGTGTNFTAAGSLIRAGCTLVTLANPVQVFQITAINSATQLTVTPAANPAIAAGTAYAILLSDSLSVDGLAQNIAETLMLYQRNISGFADVMNGAGDVTITINGVAVTVPGQKALAKKGANSDITSLSGLTTALSIGQGGTGAKTAADAATALGLGTSNAPYFSSLELSAATPFIDFHFNKGTDDYNIRLINGLSGVLQLVGQMDSSKGFMSRAGMDGPTDVNVPWNFFWNYGGNVGLSGFVGVTNLGRITFTTSSDAHLKKDIQYVATPDNALAEVLQWKPAHFKMKARGVIPESDDMLGFIANDLVTVSPECVGGSGLVDGYDEDNPTDAYYLKEVPMIAKLTQAIQAQQKLIDDLTARIAALESKKSVEPIAE